MGYERQQQVEQNIENYIVEAFENDSTLSQYPVDVRGSFVKYIRLGDMIEVNHENTNPRHSFSNRIKIVFDQGSIPRSRLSIRGDRIRRRSFKIDPYKFEEQAFKEKLLRFTKKYLSDLKDAITKEEEIQERARQRIEERKNALKGVAEAYDEFQYDEDTNHLYYKKARLEVTVRDGEAKIKVEYGAYSSTYVKPEDYIKVVEILGV